MQEKTLDPGRSAGFPRNPIGIQGALCMVMVGSTLRRREPKSCLPRCRQRHRRPTGGEVPQLVATTGELWWILSIFLGRDGENWCKRKKWRWFFLLMAWSTNADLLMIRVWCIVSEGCFRREGYAKHEDHEAFTVLQKHTFSAPLLSWKEQVYPMCPSLLTSLPRD